MSKKKAQKQKKKATKKPFKIVKHRNSSKKSDKAEPNIETEQRNIQTQKVSNTKKVDKKEPNVKEEGNNYYITSLYNTFYTYSEDMLNKYLEEENNKENLIQINEEILTKFGLTKDLRKYAFKYLWETLKPYNTNKKLYFKTTSIFDSFLVNYSENNSQEVCTQFFLSKHDGLFSETKLIMFTLCCFFIVSQVYNTQNFELKCLEKWDEKDEFTYDELNELIYIILKAVDCNIDNLNIYDILNLLLFDLNKKLKNVKDENGFIAFLNQSVNIFSVKIVQDISLNDVLPSAQSLGIIMFSWEYTKFMMQNNNKNDNINSFVDIWIQNVKNILLNLKQQDVKRVIHWLNEYVNTH